MPVHAGAAAPLVRAQVDGGRGARAEEDGRVLRAEVALVGRDELALAIDLGGEMVTR